MDGFVLVFYTKSVTNELAYSFAQSSTFDEEEFFPIMRCYKQLSSVEFHIGCSYNQMSFVIKYSLQKMGAATSSATEQMAKNN
ncbi:Hypothetical predicted protein, partial [Paramuricea clavata]